MKLFALKRGGLDTLNIYTVNDRTLLGYAWLARMRRRSACSTAWWSTDDRVPAGNFEDYSEGGHRGPRGGHWIDLFTRRRRLQQGDLVDDTAPRRSARSSRRGQGHVRRCQASYPITNFMGTGHAGRLHVRVHRGPGRAVAAGLGRVPRVAGTSDVEGDRRWSPVSSIEVMDSACRSGRLPPCPRRRRGDGDVAHRPAVGHVRARPSTPSWASSPSLLLRLAPAGRRRYASSSVGELATYSSTLVERLLRLLVDTFDGSRINRRLGAASSAT